MAETLQPSAAFEPSFPPTAHLNGELCCSVPLAIWPISYYCRRETRGQRHTAGQGQAEAGLVILQVASCPLPHPAPFPSCCRKSRGSCSHGNLGLTWLALDFKHIAHPLSVTFPPFTKHGLSQTFQGYSEDGTRQASQGLACHRCPMLSAFALHCKCSCK